MAAEEISDISDSIQDGYNMLQHTELLRPRETVVEKDSLQIPIRLLPGETRLFHGMHTEGEIMLTNYRLFISYSASFLNFPVRLIEAVECKDLTLLSVTCKDATMASCTLLSSDSCAKWVNKIKSEIAPVNAFNDFFAMHFFLNSLHDKTQALWDVTMCRAPEYKFGDEVHRLGFNLKSEWRITTLNENYKFCESYPKELLVPKDFSDESLQKVAKFRTLRRVPAAVWRDKNGPVIFRSSQPEVGVFCSRNQADEDLLSAMIRACGAERLLVVDARSYTAAVANRAKGGGCEYPQYYTNCDIEFMNLPNIHAIRLSFTAVRALSTTVDSNSWYSSLESTKWMNYLSSLLCTAQVVVDAITVRKVPVLVHCSDGWDRTPQIVSLAQLLLDPYYRTYKGFQVLVEKEWLAFGHKFADRCGHTKRCADQNEMSPVFTQWLDAVYQLNCQFPTAFEFNEAYLIKLLQHTHSCLFGTFLFNCEKERQEESLSKHTASVWSLLDGMKNKFVNPLYQDNGPKVLAVRCHPRDLLLWSNVYAPRASYTPLMSPSDDVVSLGSYHRSHSFSECLSSTDSELPVMIKGSHHHHSDPDLSFPSHDGGSEGDSDFGQINGFSPAAHSQSLAADVFINGSKAAQQKGLRTRNSSNASSKSMEINSATSRSQISQKIDFTKYLDVDGHVQPINLLQLGLGSLVEAYEREVDRLRRHIAALETCAGKRNGFLNSPTADSGGSSPSSLSSVGGRSGSSWEELEDRDVQTKWVPDHAVHYCSSCASKFTILRRKHHCRSCGNVFCSSCANVFIPLPDQDLLDSVRVCKNCHHKRVKSLNNLRITVAEDLLKTSETMDSNNVKCERSESPEPRSVENRTGDVSDPLVDVSDPLVDAAEGCLISLAVTQVICEAEGNSNLAVKNGDLNSEAVNVNPTETVLGSTRNTNIIEGLPALFQDPNSTVELSGNIRMDSVDHRQNGYMMAVVGVSRSGLETRNTDSLLSDSECLPFNKNSFIHKKTCSLESLNQETGKEPHMIQPRTQC